MSESAPKKMKVPHTFVLLFSLIVLAVIGTHVLPAGEYDRVTDEKTGRTVVAAESYHAIEPSPVGFMDTFIAVQKGMVDAADVVFFVFIVYASFFIVLQTGAIHSFIGWLLRVMEGKEILIIPVFMYLFALGGSIFGMYEETFGFIPVFVGLAVAMGYDAIVGMSMVCFGVAMGFAAAFMNPFTVGLAQKFAELPLFSGMLFRIVSWLVMVTLAVLWTVRYARKIKADPSKSFMAGVDMGSLNMNRGELMERHFKGREKVILAVVVFSVGLLIWGVIIRGWYFDEIAGLFIIMGLACGFLAGWGPSKVASTFLEGARDIVFGALVIGISRGILVVMREGHIIDTVIYGLAQPLAEWPRWLAAEGMLAVQTLINFFIPSGSGQAATTMPIMAPLSDLLEVPRQVAVLAYQYGDGFSNILWPTTLLPVMCSIAKVPIDRWWRFFLPFFVILLPVQAIFIAVAVSIGWH
ncbi:MAG TPA: TIGR00366 family protein [Synergistaceae bacterium]|nr:TIGR00366 family protein [Synergistaceae bacterium]HPQ37969.1 TIGR00366 family protein [Synergistaceae bacterium]